MNIKHRGTTVLLAALLGTMLASSVHSQSTVKFGVIGDWGSGLAPADQVATLVNSWDPDFVVTVGDNNYPDGEASTIDYNIGRLYSRYIGNYQGAYGPGASTNQFFPALGNHDMRGIFCNGSTCGGAHFDYFDLPGNERWFKISRGPIDFFFVNSDPGEPVGTEYHQPQGDWLAAEVAASEAPFKVAVFHHPPYSSGPYDNFISMQWPYGPLGIDLVLAGHSHTYERLFIDGVTYVVNGLGGRSLYEFNRDEPGSVSRFSGEYGAMQVTADANTLTGYFYTVDGQLRDTFSIDAEGSGGNASNIESLTLSASQNGEDAAYIEWTSVGEVNISSYTVQRSKNGGAWSNVGTGNPRNYGPGQEATYDLPDDGLEPGVYQYRVAWTGADGESGTSNSDEVTVSEQSQISVGDLELVRDFERMKVSWDATGQQSGQVFTIQSSYEDGAWEDKAQRTAADGQDSFVATLSGLAVGTYKIRIAWDNGSGVQYSTHRQLQMVSAVDWASVEVNQEGKDLVISWTTSREFGLDRFSVSSILNQESEELWGNVDARGTVESASNYTYRITNQSLGDYKLRVLAFGLDENGSSSQEVEISLGPIAEFSNPRALLDGDQIKVEWGTTDEVFLSGFQVEAVRSGDTVSLGEEDARGGVGQSASYFVIADYPGLDYDYRIRWIGVNSQTGTSETFESQNAPFLDADAPPAVITGIGSVYPNPASGEFVVRYGLDGEPGRLQVVNLLGMVVHDMQAEAGPTAKRATIQPVTSLPAGLYMVRLVRGREVLGQKTVSLIR